MAQEVLFKWSSVENKQTNKIRISVKKKDTLGTKKEQTPRHTHTHTHTHSLNHNVNYKTKELYSFKSGLTT